MSEKDTKRRDPLTVSKIMSSIRSSDTSIERTVRKGLWKAGLRYRKNYGKLPGKPDIVFTKQKVVVFLDSDFWHGREWDQLRERLNTNPDYWIPKIQRNINRDKQINRELQEMGWAVLRFWESDIKSDPEICIYEIVNYLSDKRKQQEG